MLHRTRHLFIRQQTAVINAIRAQADISSREMRTWYQTLAQDEKDRRAEFTRQFDATRLAFAQLPLSQARNVSVHRTGLTPVTVAVTGFFGVTYTGDQTTPIPGTETREIDDPKYAFLSRPSPLRPKWSDFYFGNQQLHPECQSYIKRVQEITDGARVIVQNVQGQNNLTAPPG
jgi:hypothetical protein